ncbi:hypothetical protein [Aliiroseovarius crassostreae]|uniref:hypothetical protein n=1 Tax=Aliiroseovarius crassostreae TaxID=154981 RepID=UPI003C7E8EE8
MFEIADDRARLRDDYDRFKMDQAKQERLEFETAATVKLKAPFQLEAFAPKIKYDAMEPGELQASPYFPNIFYVDVYPVWPFIPLPVLEYAFPLGPGINHTLPPSEFEMTMPPAGSVATVSVQHNILFDNDVIIGEGLVDFLSPDSFMAPLEDLVEQAEALLAFDVGRLPNSEQTAEEIAQGWQDLIEGARNDGILNDAPDGASISVQFGASVNGIYVNGELVDELPDLTTLLPVRLQIDEDHGTGTVIENGQTSQGEGISGIDTTASALKAGNTTDAPSPWMVPAGHNITMGGNFLINEASIAMSWLDAPVMAVMGNVFSINAISQVNVVSDHDTGLAPNSDLTNDILNVSSVSQFTNPFAPGTGALPSHWLVAELDADLIAANWVEQFNFAIDNDIAEVSLSGQDTWLRLGDNSLVNVNKIAEFGFGYDLIIIGGSIININAIGQMNVLFDNDISSASGGEPGHVNGSGNVVANFAGISSTGVDSYSALGHGMASVFDQIEEGLSTIHDAFAQLEQFNGIELLRVLHIKGDLIQMNLVKQTNILGDADQVHVALDNFLGEHGDVAINTGENGLLNVASIGVGGIDSDIYVGGEVYSDAMLVQADLIDTDADPLGVSLASGDLANEAVAFLADDMIPTDPEQGHDPAIVPTAVEDSSSTDSLQVMLA